MVGRWVVEKNSIIRFRIRDLESFRGANRLNCSSLTLVAQTRGSSLMLYFKAGGGVLVGENNLLVAGGLCH